MIPRLPDSSKLEKADPAILHAFTNIRTYGFDSVRLNALTGKEVTRYVNVSDREVDYLRRHVLAHDETLLTLVDLLLFGRAVPTRKVPLPKAVIRHFKDLGLFTETTYTKCTAFIAPLNGNYFLNDGETDKKDHVFALAQEQAYIIEACNRFLGKGNKILDLCSGSGVIGQCLVQYSSRGVVHGVDINERAVHYARFNALLNNKNATYERGNAMSYRSNAAYDLIVATPPLQRQSDQGQS
jgi:hypothetical protein